MAANDGMLEGGATSAPLNVQASGLQDTFFIVTIVMMIPLADCHTNVK